MEEPSPAIPEMSPGPRGHRPHFSELPMGRHLPGSALGLRSGGVVPRGSPRAASFLCPNARPGFDILDYHVLVRGFSL